MRCYGLDYFSFAQIGLRGLVIGFSSTFKFSFLFKIRGLFWGLFLLNGATQRLWGFGGLFYLNGSGVCSLKELQVGILPIFRWHVQPFLYQVFIPGCKRRKIIHSRWWCIWRGRRKRD